MLLFIEYLKMDISFLYEFQYISCCCFIEKKARIEQIKAIKFQYISCCCLSMYHLTVNKNSRVSIHLMLLFICFQERVWNNNLWFQYISCCCFYLFSQVEDCICLCSFNTSHVVVYRVFPFSVKNKNKVFPIHLMLLFINLPLCVQ